MKNKRKKPNSKKVNVYEGNIIIETDIDRILNMIDQKVTVDDIVEETGLEESYVFGLARILENHGAIEIVYPLISGRPFFRKSCSNDLNGNACRS
jgi:hypothetical protein